MHVSHLTREVLHVYNDNNNNLLLRNLDDKSPNYISAYMYIGR